MAALFWPLKDPQRRETLRSKGRLLSTGAGVPPLLGAEGEHSEAENTPTRGGQLLQQAVSSLSRSDGAGGWTSRRYVLFFNLKISLVSRIPAAKSNNKRERLSEGTSGYPVLLREFKDGGCEQALLSDWRNPALAGAGKSAAESRGEGAGGIAALTLLAMAATETGSRRSARRPGRTRQPHDPGPEKRPRRRPELGSSAAENVSGGYSSGDDLPLAVMAKAETGARCSARQACRTQQPHNPHLVKMPRQQPEPGRSATDNDSGGYSSGDDLPLTAMAVAKTSARRSAWRVGQTQQPHSQPLAKAPRQQPAPANFATDSDSGSYSSGDDLPLSFHGSEELSVYEKKRMKNIQENAQFFASLNMLETAKVLWGHVRKEPRRQLHASKRRIPKSSGEQPTVRRSKRLLNLKPSETVDPKVQVETSVTMEEREERFSGPLKMVASNEVNEEVTEDLMTKWLEISQGDLQVKIKQSKDLETYKTNINRMVIQEDLVAKVTRKRVCSLAIHPSQQRFLVAAGSSCGYVGVWDLSSRTNDAVAVDLFKPHCGAVNCLHFSPSNSAELLSVSNDGTIRCGNVVASVFDEVYVSKKWNTSSFDFLAEDGSTLIVGHWDGDVAVVDRRTPSISGEQKRNLGVERLRTVSVHPVDRHYFVTAATRCATIYDVRNLKPSPKKAVAHMDAFIKYVSSAYFSPVTGNRLVTTSMDDRIRVFDTSAIISKIPCVTSIIHNNFTGRWLTKFQAVWDPKREDCFVVGSMARPRQIEVFHSTGTRVHTFKDAEWLGSVCSINVMHPTANVLVGGNSSGRLHVFMDCALSG
ncbi:WD repeat-containing protein 76-like [Narcine bancroftii]|uniref:WD repeat-containing protein 76-like n=1 Tax=Narcine bancroftii TaxID=1343680 RepID=UPI0038311D0B